MSKSHTDARVLPMGILRDHQHRIRQIGRRRRGRQAPPRRREPGDRVEHPVRHRDHPACEHHLHHERHHCQRQHLIVVLRQRRHQQADDRRRHTRRRDTDEQLERRTAQQRRAHRRALADRHDQNQDGRLDHRDRAEHRDLGREIRRRRQPDRLLAAEDGAFADQCANSQRGPHEERTEVHHHQDLLCLVRRGAVECSLAEAGVAGHGERQQPDEERQQGQEHEVTAVGDEQPQLSTRNRRELAPQVGLHDGCPTPRVARTRAGPAARRRRPARSRYRRWAASGSALMSVKMSAQSVVPIAARAHWAVRRMRSCRRGQATALGRTRPDRPANASRPR